MAAKNANPSRAHAAGALQGPRYSCQPSGFPSRYLVWDHLKGDNLRGAQLPGRPRHPYFTRETIAQRIADRLNRQDRQSESLSYGVRCLSCLEWETACRCED